jgi:hypothetical protein
MFSITDFSSPCFVSELAVATVPVPHGLHVPDVSSSLSMYYYFIISYMFSMTRWEKIVKTNAFYFHYLILVMYTWIKSGAYRATENIFCSKCFK